MAQELVGSLTEADGHREMSALVSGPVTFALIPPHHWYQPDWIDEDKASRSRDDLVEQNIIYGGVWLSAVLVSLRD